MQFRSLAHNVLFTKLPIQQRLQELGRKNNSRCLSMDGLIMETKKFTNIQDFMRFLNYSKEDIMVKYNKAYNASKNEMAELIINNKNI